MSRFAISLRLGMTANPLIPNPYALIPTREALGFFRALRPVLGSSLHPSLHAHGVERAAHDVIANARQVLHASAANQHQRVFLKVVTDTRDVGRHLDAVREPHARHLAQRRIRFLGRLGEDAHADAALLRAVLQGRALGLADDLFTPRADKLTDGRHSCFSQLANWRISELANRSPIHEFSNSPNDNGAATAARAFVSGLEAIWLGA